MANGQAIAKVYLPKAVAQVYQSHFSLTFTLSQQMLHVYQTTHNKLNMLAQRTATLALGFWTALLILSHPGVHVPLINKYTKSRLHMANTPHITYKN